MKKLWGFVVFCDDDDCQVSVVEKDDRKRLTNYLIGGWYMYPLYIGEKNPHKSGLTYEQLIAKYEEQANA